MKKCESSCPYLKHRCECAHEVGKCKENPQDSSNSLVQIHGKNKIKSETDFVEKYCTRYAQKVVASKLRRIDYLPPNVK